MAPYGALAPSPSPLASAPPLTAGGGNGGGGGGDAGDGDAFLTLAAAAADGSTAALMGGMLAALAVVAVWVLGALVAVAGACTRRAWPRG